MERPIAAQPHYGAHLGDAGYWEPWITEALTRVGLPRTSIEAPFVGTFPTFLVGDVAVKLFGPSFEGPASFANERGMHALLAATDIPAPRLLASGFLFEDEPRWPYLVTERVRAVALRESPRDRAGVAPALGRFVAQLHALDPPPHTYRHLPRLRVEAASRARQQGYLPGHLIEQIADYLADALQPDTLVHADLTEDHVFVAGGELQCVIDWGDALVADRYYELVPVFFDSIGVDAAARRAFLDGYGWRVGDDFARRAMQAVLEFEFAVMRRIAESVDLAKVRTLDDLAERLFTF